jgi:hypothetical protein
MNLVTYPAFNKHLFFIKTLRTMNYDIFIRPDTKRKSGEQITMAFVPDPIVLLNLGLCVVILLLGYLVYHKRDIISALFIGIAFGIFGLSHLNTLFVPPLFPEVTFALLRICGYLIIAAALYLLLTERPCHHEEKGRE